MVDSLGTTRSNECGNVTVPRLLVTPTKPSRGTHALTATRLQLRTTVAYGMQLERCIRRSTHQSIQRRDCVHTWSTMSRTPSQSTSATTTSM
jgi:hypothetical protein